MQRLIKPYISFEDVKEDFQKIFETGWFSKGEYCNGFVEEIRKYTGAKHAFLTSSATTALWICLKALEVGVGDEVIVSDFSFPATVNVVEDLGATPIFADVYLDTYNMNPVELERKITKKTKAVIFVDALGNPSGITNIKSICNKYSIPLIQDSACGVGSSEKGLKCGNIADFTCFSFHPRKLLTTGEGGAITVNDYKYIKFFNIKLNHGAVVEEGKFNFVDYGYNFRISELQSAMGIVQMKKIDDIVESRNKIKLAYSKMLIPLGFISQKTSSNVVHNVQSVVFTVPKSVDRGALMKFLKDYKIETIFGTYCLSGTEYYSKKYNDIQPNAKTLFEKTITLPCFDGVDIDYVCEKIREFCIKC